MDSFTGLNVSKAEWDILNLNNSLNNVQFEISSTFRDLGEYVSEHWAGPNAVNFDNTYNPKIDAFITEFRNRAHHIVDGAGTAASTLASAFGVSIHSQFGDDYTGQHDTLYRIGSFHCKEDINGNVGMDTEGMKVQIDALKIRTNKINGLFDEVPTGIAFCDPQGSLISQYSTNVTDLKAKFSALMDEIVADMTASIETEVNNIRLAKQQAIDAMQNANA